MPRATKRVKQWFDWPGDPDGAKAEFVLLTDQDLTEIQDKARKTRAVSSRATLGMEIEVATDSSIMRRETALRATCAWEGFFDADGKPMECNDQSKEFWSCNAGFMAFLSECQEKLKEVADAEEAEARKNSKR